MPLRSPARVFLASGLLLLSTPALTADFEQLRELEKVGARVTAVAIDLTDLKVIAERNAEVRLTPASLTNVSPDACGCSPTGSPSPLPETQTAPRPNRPEGCKQSG